MLYLSLTFDYELFMGGNFLSEEQILVRPTENLVKVLDDAGVKATFFADVCSAMRYRELQKGEYADLFDNQLRQLHASGHDVQLHIHPHWLAATEVGASVQFPPETYRLHNWGDSIYDIIKSGKSYLTSLLSDDYRCIAFRAGGYCLQPEQQLVPFLIKEGILIDSSVCIGQSFQNAAMFYDYRKYPKHPNMYLDSQNGIIDAKVAPTDNSLLEVPVGGYRTLPFRWIASKLNKPIIRETPNGAYMQFPNANARVTRLGKIRNRFLATNMLTVDSYNARSLLYMIRRLKKELRADKNDFYVALIGHPKTMSEARLKELLLMLRDLSKEKHVSFITMAGIASKRFGN